MLVTLAPRSVLEITSSWAYVYHRQLNKGHKDVKHSTHNASQSVYPPDWKVGCLGNWIMVKNIDWSVKHKCRLITLLLSQSAEVSFHPSAGFVVINCCALPGHLGRRIT